MRDRIGELEQATAQKMNVSLTNPTAWERAVVAAIKDNAARLSALEQLKSHPWLLHMFEASDEQPKPPPTTEAKEKRLGVWERYDPKPPPTTAGSGEAKAGIEIFEPNGSPALRDFVAKERSKGSPLIGAEPPPQAEKCETCGGVGVWDPGPPVRHVCGVCKGTGQRPADEAGVAERLHPDCGQHPPVTCKHCGEVMSAACPACGNPLFAASDELRAEVERLRGELVAANQACDIAGQQRDTARRELAEERKHRQTLASDLVALSRGEPVTTANAEIVRGMMTEERKRRDAAERDRDVTCDALEIKTDELDRAAMKEQKRAEVAERERDALSEELEAAQRVIERLIADD